MKRLKLKNALKLSPLMAVALPISLAAACGDTLQTLTSDQLSNNGKLANAKNIVEITYQEKLLKELNPGFDNTNETTIFNSPLSSKATAVKVSDFAKYYINQKIYSDKDYLKNYGQTLLGQSQQQLIKIANGTDPQPDAKGNYLKVQYADLYRYRLLDEITETNTAWVTLAPQSALFEELIKQMFKSNLNGFKNEFYQMLIVANYLDLNKADYDAVYHGASTSTLYREYATTDVEVDEASFNLTRNVIKAKPFYTWTASLTEEQSKAYIDQKNLTLATIDALINSTTDASSQFPLTFSAKNKLVPSFMQTLLTKTTTTTEADLLKNLMGFQGIQTRSAVGSKSLSFFITEMRSVNTAAAYDKAYVGYVFENQLKRDKIEFFASGAKTVSVTRIAGIMPLFENSKFNVKQFDANYLKMALYFLNSKDLYDEAITYYTNKTSPIKLKITDKYLEKLAIDSFGFKFVENTSTN